MPERGFSVISWRVALLGTLLQDKLIYRGIAIDLASNLSIIPIL